MGLPRPALRLLIREHRRRPLGGSILCLGHQNVYATYDRVLKMLAEDGVTPAPLPEGFDPRTNIPAWRGTVDEDNISDEAFLRLLGAETVQAMDVSDHEGAQIIHDLNRPIPPSLQGRFDMVLDGGTLEHVFDVRQALANVAGMVKSGGRVFHISPANNFFNHGFYQFSATLFFDYYEANGFANPRGYLIEYGACEAGAYRGDIYELTSPYDVAVASASARTQMLLVFVADKIESSTVDQVPTQTYYRYLTAGAPTGKSHAPGGLRAAVRRVVPVSLKTWLSRSIIACWLNPRRKPWGQRPLGRMG